MRLTPAVLVATFALLAASYAADRVMPLALAEGTYGETKRAREDYKQSRDDLKKWDAARALPLSGPIPAFVLMRSWCLPKSFWTVARGRFVLRTSADAILSFASVLL
jgi:hypothetical protein